MSNEEGRLDYSICGRLVGTVTGWDYVNELVVQLYDLMPHPDYKGPSDGYVDFDFERGKIEARDEDGEVTASCDLIDAIKDCLVRGKEN
jgi:hypothetical protein